MGKPKQIKPKEDRVKEGIHLLKELKGAGVKEYSFGYIELKTKITEWITSEDGWDGTIGFEEYGRQAEVDLPKYDNKPAGINFKVKKMY